MKKIYNLIMLIIAISCLTIAYNIYQGKQREYREAKLQEEQERKAEEERLEIEKRKVEEIRQRYMLEEAEKKRKAEEEARIKQEQADTVKAGNELLETGKYDEAIIKFNKVIELGFTDASIYNSLGVSYEKSGKTQEALGYYKKALEINPDFKSASINIKSLEYEILSKQIAEDVKPLAETLQSNQSEMEKCHVEIQAVEKEISGLAFEVINLVGGSQMKGIITEETPDSVNLAIGTGAQVTLSKEKIESISRLGSEEKVKVNALWKRASVLKEKESGFGVQIAEINKKIAELKAALNKPYYDLQTAKGLIVYEGKWTTPDEKAKLEAEKKRFEEERKASSIRKVVIKDTAEGSLWTKEPIKPKLYSFTNDKSGLVNLILNLVPQPPGADITYDTTYQSLLVTNTTANLKLIDEIVSKANSGELQSVIERLIWSKGEYKNIRYGFEIERPVWLKTTILSVTGPVVTPPYGATCQFGMTLQGEKSNVRFLIYQLKEATTSQDYALARKVHPEPEFANGWIDKKKSIYRDGTFWGFQDSYRTTDIWSTGQKEILCSRIHMVKEDALYEIVQICLPEDFQKTEEQNLFSFIRGLKFFQPMVLERKSATRLTNNPNVKVTTADGDPYKNDIETARALSEKKDFTKAIQILEKVIIKKGAGTRGEEALFQIGYIRGFCLNEYDSGIKVFEEFKKLYPKSTSIEQASRSIALLYFKKNDYKTAEERFMELLEKYPTKETANFIKHYLYVMKNCKEKRI